MLVSKIPEQTHFYSSIIRKLIGASVEIFTIIRNFFADPAFIETRRGKGQRGEDRRQKNRCFQRRQPGRA